MTGTRSSLRGLSDFLELEVRRVDCRHCGAVKRERLNFLADNACFTKRFAFCVGRRCAQAWIRDITLELKLDWDTVKTLDMQYMQAQIDAAGPPAPLAIGIDEISVRNGMLQRTRGFGAISLSGAAVPVHSPMEICDNIHKH